MGERSAPAAVAAPWRDNRGRSVVSKRVPSERKACKPREADSKAALDRADEAMQQLDQLFVKDQLGKGAELINLPADAAPRDAERSEILGALLSGDLDSSAHARILKIVRGAQGDSLFNVDTWRAVEHVRMWAEIRVRLPDVAFVQERDADVHLAHSWIGTYETALEELPVPLFLRGEPRPFALARYPILGQWATAEGIADQLAAIRAGKLTAHGAVAAWLVAAIAAGKRFDSESIATIARELDQGQVARARKVAFDVVKKAWKREGARRAAEAREERRRREESEGPRASLARALTRALARQKKT